MVDGEVVEGTVVDGVDEAKPDFTVVLAGREIGFKSFTAAQLVMLQALMRRFGTSDTGTMDALVAAWNAIESRILTEDDQRFVNQAMIRGELELEDALSVMRQGRPVDGDDDVEPPSLKAKKTANAARKRR